MLEQPHYEWPGDEADLRALIAKHPWVTIVSDTSRGMVVSHMPVLPESSGVDVVSHLPWEDAEKHELGSCDVVMIVQGPHGYVSASWYVGGPYVSTWDFVVVHLHGRPVVLDAEETYAVLDRTMDHFERHRPEPFRLEQVAEYAHQLAPAVAGFRLSPTRVVAKAKLSQEKPKEDVDGVLQGLQDAEDVHRNPGLATAMRTWGPA